MDNIQKLNKQDIPKLLSEIPDPPKELYLRGSLPDPYQYIYLTIVGSRKFTNYGKTACEKIIEGLREYPIVIVSGLALGMDSIAHNSAMENGLKTVAIPGSGISDSAMYPATNLSLANRILLNGGALLSEYEPDFRATQWSFPRRNRIMAGISRATLIIEAGPKSGTLITAYLAVDYDREVMAVPGSIFSTTSKGSNELIRDGAIPILSSKDILNALSLSDETDFSESVKAKDLGNLSQEEKNILDNLEERKQSSDLSREINIPIQKLNIILTKLELKGLVRVENGFLEKCI